MDCNAMAMLQGSCCAVTASPVHRNVAARCGVWSAVVPTPCSVLLLAGQLVV